MGSSTSPNNDPVFYLNHCNVDRIGQDGRKYTIVLPHPDAQNDARLRGHCLNDRYSAQLQAHFLTLLSQQSSPWIS